MLTLNGILQPTPQIAGHAVNHICNIITFDDDTTPVVVFTVTGSVVVKILAECLTNCESNPGCNAQLGITGAEACFIVSTDVTALEAGEIWHDASPDSNRELLSVTEQIVLVGGPDIILTLDAQWDSGEVAFHCFWTPLHPDGLVVAA